jgi:hypothetical protein
LRTLLCEAATQGEAELRNSDCGLNRKNASRFDENLGAFLLGAQPKFLEYARPEQSGELAGQLYLALDD